jgi:hypothetical protein
MATAWQRTYESAEDLSADIIVEEREAERRAVAMVEQGQANDEGPFVRTEAPTKQLQVAREAAQFILNSGVLPSGPILVRLNGYDGPENQTDSITVTVQQR